MGTGGRCPLEAGLGVQSELGCMCRQLAIHTHTHRHTGLHASGCCEPAGNARGGGRGWLQRELTPEPPTGLGGK